MKKWYYNPVLASSLKTRMRGWRTAASVTAYLGVMLFIAYIFFKIYIEAQAINGISVNANQSVGLQVYLTLAIIQFALILLITPAQTAGVVSSEREMQTLDLLLCTKMSSAAIIMGKLLSSLGFILLLIIASIPLFSLVLLFGGIALEDIAILFLFYIVTAFGVGSIGVFYSTLFKRTVVSTVVTYVTIFFLGIVSVVLGTYMMAMHYSQPSQPADYYIPFILYINPGVGLADLLSTQAGGQYVLPYGIIGLLIGQVGNIPQGWFQQLPFWVKNIGVISIIATLLLVISTWSIRPNKRMGARIWKVRRSG
ncbi:MAG: ABC transporter permease [Clostridiales bacterium]|jgi:ABC-type transport system involved in multi-copper enzyme maturation permease subunit|nr:ABC transporter permease [Clostridiales bacterium]